MPRINIYETKQHKPKDKVYSKITLNAYKVSKKRYFSCTRKQKYSSKKQANKVRRILLQTKKIHLVAYKCSHCEGYHLGKFRIFN